MNVPKVFDVNEACKGVLIKLEKNGFKLKKVIPINHNRYIIVIGKPNNILIMYKRDVFHNFGEMFRYKGFYGCGDTINIKDLREAVRHNVKEIYTTFPDGKIYTITLGNFVLKSIKWSNKEGKEVRSISIHEYKRVD